MSIILPLQPLCVKGEKEGKKKNFREESALWRFGGAAPRKSIPAGDACRDCAVRVLFGVAGVGASAAADAVDVTWIGPAAVPVYFSSVVVLTYGKPVVSVNIVRIFGSDFCVCKLSFGVKAEDDITGTDFASILRKITNAVVEECVIDLREVFPA
ncbi:MAG: hypothetical protein HDT14_02140 [Oscillibacter sp.]|nr:hypothetical protein [Oscillibacter sp.]